MIAQPLRAVLVFNMLRFFMYNILVYILCIFLCLMQPLCIAQSLYLAQSLANNMYMYAQLSNI